LALSISVESCQEKTIKLLGLFRGRQFLTAQEGQRRIEGVHGHLAKWAIQTDLPI
jgi:hypothetical protein